jgi:hypothetical protein
MREVEGGGGGEEGRRNDHTTTHPNWMFSLWRVGSFSWNLEVIYGGKKNTYIPEAFFGGKFLGFFINYTTGISFFLHKKPCLDPDPKHWRKLT